MSVWSSVDGKVVVHKTSRLSIKKLIEDIFNECGKPTVSKTKESCDEYTYSISFSFCEDGNCAVELFKEFHNRLTDYFNCKVDVELTTRWIN